MKVNSFLTPVSAVAHAGDTDLHSRIVSVAHQLLMNGINTGEEPVFNE